MYNYPDCDPAIPISSGLYRCCLKIPSPAQYAIGIWKIPILTSVTIFSMKTFQSLRQKYSPVYIILGKWKGFKRYLKATINFFITRYSYSIVCAWWKASCYFCVMFLFLETTQDCSLPVNSRKERRNKSSTGRVSSDTYTQQYCPVCFEEVKNCFWLLNVCVVRILKCSQTCTVP